MNNYQTELSRTKLPSFQDSFQLRNYSARGRVACEYSDRAAGHTLSLLVGAVGVGLWLQSRGQPGAR